MKIKISKPKPIGEQQLKIKISKKKSIREPRPCSAMIM